MQDARVFALDENVRLRVSRTFDKGDHAACAADAAPLTLSVLPQSGCDTSLMRFEPLFAA
jgi:hypothetical protein